MDDMSVTDEMANNEPYRSQCPKWKQCLGWAKERIYKLNLLVLSCFVLCASSLLLPNPTARESKAFFGHYGYIAELLARLPNERQISYVRNVAPRQFQDLSVLLDDTDHDSMDLIAVPYLVDGINASVDPCEDFYEFACGNDNYDKISMGHFADTAFHLRRRITEILENWNATSSHSRPMNLAVEFYNQCRNETAINDGMESVYKILKNIGGWPSIDPHWSHEQFDFLKMTAEARRLYGHSPFFSIFVSRHPQNRSRNVIYLQIPDFTFPEEIMSDQITVNYNSYNSHYARTVYEIAGLNGLNYGFDALEAYQLEQRLVMAVTQDSDSSEPLKVTTLEKFQLKMNKVNVAASHANINWSHLLNLIFKTSGTTVKPNQEIVVGDILFMKKLVEILDIYSPRALANYIQWTLIRQWLPLLFRNNDKSGVQPSFSSILRTLTSVNTAGDDLNHTCLSETMTIFALPLYQEFVRRSIFPPSDRSAVHDMATAVQESFMEIIRENTWISDSARAKALEKIEGMRHFVGYPDWITNDTRMDEEFRQLQFGSDQVDNVLNLIEWISNSNFKTLNLDGVDLWMLGGTIGSQKMPSVGTVVPFVHDQVLAVEIASLSIHFYSHRAFGMAAYHIQRYNSILISMGIATIPFYFSSGPAYVNFGKLGRVIGLEIAHEFDSNGIKYDAHGNQKEWLNSEDQEKFEANTVCFVKQYGQYEDLPGKKVNGASTLNENIADNVGLQLAYRAYERAIRRGQVEQPKKLLGLEKLTPDQLFFLSYISSNCEGSNLSSLKSALVDGKYSPNKYRVIGPLQNSREFAQAWKCPLGAPMNPTAKCAAW